MFTLCHKVFSASAHVFVILSFLATEEHSDENSRAEYRAGIATAGS